MFKDSGELLEYAIRLLELSERYHQYYVGINLAENFPNNDTEISNFCNQLKLEEAMTIIKERFTKYKVQSKVKIKGIDSSQRKASLGLLVWEITLRTKK